MPDTFENKENTIIVNGQAHTTALKEMSFLDVIEFGFGNSNGGGNIVFTVSYRRGHGNKDDGSLLEGGTVRVKEGMIFNVTKTDKS